MAQEKAEVDSRGALVLDANILIRAGLGRRVRRLIEAYSERVSLLVPAPCVQDARKYLAEICIDRKLDITLVEGLLNSVLNVISVIESDLFESFESQAKLRIGARDMDDWPVVALALAVRAPIGTEDADFFGTGVPTWTTRTVEIYLNEGRGLMVQDHAAASDSVLETAMWTGTRRCA